MRLFFNINPGDGPEGHKNRKKCRSDLSFCVTHDTKNFALVFFIYVGYIIDYVQVYF
jgi:hypothetical protein